MNYIIRNVKNAKCWNGVGWINNVDDAIKYSQKDVHEMMKELRSKGERVTFEVVETIKKTWR